MKGKISKLIGIIGGVGALCALCCSLPVLGLMGFGALEVLFCENEILKGIGIALVACSLLYFIYKHYKRSKLKENFCSINCGCRPN